ncbi:MAG: GGDEF domain-containing protein [Actinomycetota bacterium]
MSHLPPSRFPWLLALLSALTVLALSGGWTARSVQADRTAEQHQAEVERDELAAARARVVVADAAFARVTIDLVSELDPTFGDEWDDHRAVIAAATGDLQTLVDGERLDATTAAIVGDLIEVAERTADADADIWTFEELAYVATAPSSAADPATPAEISLLATVLATSPALVATDAASLELRAELDRLAPATAEFVEGTAAVVEETPGWFGPDLDAPFLDGYLPGDLLAESDAELLDRIGSTDGLDGVWRYDMWLIDRIDRPSPPPQTATSLARDALEAQALMVAEVLDRLDESATLGADGGTTGLTIAWVAAFAVAAVSAATILALVVRRTRRLTSAALIDPLTGVGNRHRLDQLVEEWANGGSPAFAAVAVVDLDRFKLINDSYGHGVGDLVLRHVGAGLRDLTSDLGSGADRAEAIRLGGDEFAVVVASHRPQVESTLRSRIAAVGGAVEITTTESVEVGLSTGVVCASCPTDLTDLVAAADLRAYEDKERRRAVHVATPPPERVEV